MRYHSSPDHGYGGGSYYDSIECPQCSETWRVEGSTLIQRTSESGLHELEEEKKRLEAELMPIGRAVVRAHFEQRQFRHMTQEREELIRLRLWGGSIDQYRKERRNRSIQAVAAPMGNPGWIAANCNSTQRARATQIGHRLNELEAEILAARRSVVTRRIANS